MIGARLKQARLLAGLTQQDLANRLHELGYAITKQAISHFENGKRNPSAAFMLMAGDVLDVPGAYFVQDPPKPIKWLAFRRNSKLGKTQEQVIKNYASDVVELQLELRDLLYPRSRAKLPNIPTENIDDAEAAAARLREQWNVGDRPLDNLVQVAEDRNIVVVGWQDESGFFEGLSGAAGENPVTVINTNAPKDRLRMSLAHEIGHLVMNTDDEMLARRFAAALLVPAEHARHELGDNRTTLGWGELKVLKRKYGMSMAAWIIRARDLGIISESRYKDLFIEFSSNGWRKLEPVEYEGDEEPLALIQMARRAVREGTISPFRITLIRPDLLDDEGDEPELDHLTVRDLLKMPEAQRIAVMGRAFALAADDEFEIFEANEIIDD